MDARALRLARRANIPAYPCLVDADAWPPVECPLNGSAQAQLHSAARERPAANIRPCHSGVGSCHCFCFRRCSVWSGRARCRSSPCVPCRRRLKTARRHHRRSALRQLKTVRENDFGEAGLHPMHADARRIADRTHAALIEHQGRWHRCRRGARHCRCRAHVDMAPPSSTGVSGGREARVGRRSVRPPALHRVRFSLRRVRA